MMRSWWRLVWVGLAVLVAGCGVSPTSPPSTLALPTDQVGRYGPALNPDVLESIRALGLLPEYRLSLQLNVQQHRLIGDEVVVFPNRESTPLEELVFRLYPNLPQHGGQMEVGKVRVNGQTARTEQLASGTALRVDLPGPLDPGGVVQVQLPFELEVPQRDSGYVLFGQIGSVWSLPDAYPLLAVHDASGWHTDLAPPHGDAVFAEVAWYDVSLTVPPNMTLVATGTVVSHTLRTDGQRFYRVLGGPFREFAFLASADYTLAETSAYGTGVESYYLVGDETAGKAALWTAAAALRAYMEAFGPYPFAEMKVVEAPLGYRGMEFPGLSLIGQAVYDEQPDRQEFLIAHEVGHHWWYAQVGNDQVNAPWLDEALTEYSTTAYYRAVYGQGRVDTLINERWQVPYEVALNNGQDAVVGRPANAFGLNYEQMVYAKGALFFDALHRELGDATYLAVLREYLRRFQWGIATPEDLMTVAGQVSGRSLDELYSRWILSAEQP
jgi:hypothetical protein